MVSKEIGVSKGEKYSENIKDNEVIAVMIDKELHDLHELSEKDQKVAPVRLNSEEGIGILRHSTAHLLAQAVMELYPDARLNAGPITENGFYYDINMNPPSGEDLEKIEEKMHSIASRKLDIVREVHDKKELLRMFGGNRYKTDKINAHVEGRSTVYRQGDFVDFCTGPHVPNTSYLKHFKLLSIASTNYKGDVKEDRLVRIYGTAFPDDKSLKNFLRMKEEAEARDHRKIGSEMELFSFDPERAPGLPLYAPNGAVIRNELINFMRELNTRFNWIEVNTPHLFKDVLWKTSGHYYKYKDDMFLFTLADGDSYALKPMNCPGHIIIYEGKSHSYRDLPISMSEFGTVYRYEKSGEVGGLTRPRIFTVDDGHEFMRQDQIEDEIKKVLEMMKITFNVFFKELEVRYDLSIIDRNAPEKYLVGYKCNKCGTLNEPKRMASENGTVLKCEKCQSLDLSPDFTLWDSATEQLRNALVSSDLKFKEYEGEAAFYGPKIDVHIKDALGRSWQLTTIQIDFFMPIAFSLYYINSESKKETPVMLHRAIYGSVERFMVILLENSNGKLPTWISPIQAYIIPLSEQQKEYALNVDKALKGANIRTYLDDSNDSVSKKIKIGRRFRPSYFVILGQKEMENGEVSIRNRGDKIKNVKVDDFLREIKGEVNSRALEQSL